GRTAAARAGGREAVESVILAGGVNFKDGELPLRTAQARLSVIPSYPDREELGRLAADLSATFNDQRLELLRAGEQLEAEVSGVEEPVERNEEEKGISLRELEAALARASDAAGDVDK